MSRGSDARRSNRAQRRAMNRAGVALVDRVSIESDALAAAAVKGANLVDLVAFHVAEALTRLDGAGGDVLGGAVVTIGAHPDYPGAVTIEAKVSSKKREIPADDCESCPVDHSGPGE